MQFKCLLFGMSGGAFAKPNSSYFLELAIETTMETYYEDISEIDKFGIQRYFFLFFLFIKGAQTLL